MLGIISEPTVDSEKAFGSNRFSFMASLNQLSNCLKGFLFKSFMSKFFVVYFPLILAKSKIAPF